CAPSSCPPPPASSTGRRPPRRSRRRRRSRARASWPTAPTATGGCGSRSRSTSPMPPAGGWRRRPCSGGPPSSATTAPERTRRPNTRRAASAGARTLAVVAPGDPTAPADDIDDLAARLADPVLAAPKAEAPRPGDPPDVWGRLAPDPLTGAPVPPDDAAVEARANDLLDQMTTHERLHLLSGDGRLVRDLAELARHYNE